MTKLEMVKHMAEAKAMRKAQYDQARVSLHALILEALAEGETQAEVARAAGYTRETIRKISRETA